MERPDALIRYTVRTARDAAACEAQQLSDSIAGSIVHHVSPALPLKQPPCRVPPLHCTAAAVRKGLEGRAGGLSWVREDAVVRHVPTP